MLPLKFETTQMHMGQKEKFFNFCPFCLYLHISTFLFVCYVFTF